MVLSIFTILQNKQHINIFHYPLPVDSYHGDGQQGHSDVAVSDKRKQCAEYIPMNPSAMDEPGGTEGQHEYTEEQISHTQAVKQRIAKGQV